MINLFYENAFFLKNYLFLTVLGLHCFEDFFSMAVSGGYSLVGVLGFLNAVACLVEEQGSRQNYWQL